MSAFTATQEFLRQQHLQPLLSTVNQSLVTLNKWSTVGQALQVLPTSVAAARGCITMYAP